MLGAPVGSIISSRWVEWREEWTPPGYRWIYARNNHRVDIGRSLLIEKALDRRQALWMWDADVIGRQPFQEALELILEDVRAGFDAVVAPTAGSGNVAYTRPLSQANDATCEPPRNGQPFEISGALCGSFYLTYEGMKKLQPAGWYVNVKNVTHPMYCTYGLPGSAPDHPELLVTEDWDLAFRARKVGVRIVADPRLRVTHLEKKDATLTADYRMQIE